MASSSVSLGWCPGPLALALNHVGGGGRNGESGAAVHTDDHGLVVSVVHHDHTSLTNGACWNVDSSGIDGWFAHLKASPTERLAAWINGAVRAFLGSYRDFFTQLVNQKDSQTLKNTLIAEPLQIRHHADTRPWESTRLRACLIRLRRTSDRLGDPVRDHARQPLP